MGRRAPHSRKAGNRRNQELEISGAVFPKVNRLFLSSKMDFRQVGCDGGNASHDWSLSGRQIQRIHAHFLSPPRWAAFDFSRDPSNFAIVACPSPDIPSRLITFIVVAKMILKSRAIEW